MGSSATQKITFDAWAREDAPGRENPGGNKLFMKDTGTNKRRAFIYVPLPVIRPSATITTAELWLHGIDVGGNVQVQRVTGKWSEKRLNWNKMPDVAGTVYSAPLGATTVVDISALIQGVVQSRLPYKGLRLTTDAIALRSVASSEHKVHEWRPALHVEWQTPPSAPTDLRPAGGRVVSAARPTMMWTFHDRDSSDQQQAFHIKMASDSTVNASGELTTGVVMDTATVAGNVQEFLATVDVPDGTTRYWQVKVQDTSGVWSEWSPVATFARVAKGTLTIDGPAAGDITTSVPIITHTMTSAQQFSEYEVLRGGVRVYLLPKHLDVKLASVQDSFQTPWGVIDRPGEYEFIVRTWDAERREALPGDVNYYEARRVVNYAPELGVGPPAVGDLTAVPVPDRPGVRLTWTYVNPLPGDLDHFEVVDDTTGRTLAIIPETETTFDFYGLELWREHTLQVQSVATTGGHTASATVTITPEIRGKWLVAPDDGHFLFIKGLDSDSLEIGEEQQQHVAVNAETIVRKTDSIRGYEGGVAGVLMDGYGLTAREWVAEAEWFKTIRNRVPIRYIAGRHNIPVTLGRMSLADLPHGHGAPKQHSFSVEVSQAGESAFKDLL